MAPPTKDIPEDIATQLDTKGKEIETLTIGLKRTESYMIGVAVVTAFGLITLLLTSYAFFSDSLNFKANTYQSLVDIVNETNQNLEKQNEFIYKYQVDNLQEQIIDLKTRNPYLK